MMVTVWLISALVFVVSTFIEAVLNAQHNRTMWQAIAAEKNANEIIASLKPYLLPGRIFRALSLSACVIAIITTFIIVGFWIANLKP
ncbi:MAG: hypothetical protein AAB568_00760 [Patescibacteria group bacterium]